MSNEQMPPPHPDVNALAAFIDNRLSETERRAFIVHLGQCAECRGTLAAYARGALPLAAPSAGDAPSATRPLFRRVVWLPVAATLLLATTVGIKVWRMPDPASPAVAPAPPPASAAPATPDAVPPGGAALPGSEPTPGPAAAAPAAPRNPAPAPQPNTMRSGGDRLVGDKTFRLVAGEWIDAAYDPLALLPIEPVEGPGARAALLSRVPALAPYADLGARVVVVHDNVVYRFRP